MLKRTITYTDFNGVEHTEDFRFHLTTAELMEMEVSRGEGYGEWIKKIVAADDRETLIAQFKKILMASVGKLSEDGRIFDKTDEIRREFAGTNAYSNLFVEMATDATSGAEFINAVMPEGFAEDVEKMKVNLAASEAEATPAELEKTEGTPVEIKWTDFTKQQLLEMGDSEFDKLANMKPGDMPHDLLVIAMQRKNRVHEIS